MDLFRKKALINPAECSPTLVQCLTAYDLVFLGVGAIIGAGIFVITGIVAATQTGPAIVISYVVAGLACAFSALSYAELASFVGGCGSAYSYAYAGFGEIIAWLVGWDLLLEYTISVSAVSVGWSGYFNDLLHALKIHLPQDYVRSTGAGGFIDLPAVMIILLLTGLLSIGVKTSSRVNNVMVFIKLAVILLFIIIASTHVTPSNWTPFMPYGWQGVMEGASLIFFAYIGFDAVSTTAEEAINPQKDIPKGILGSLLICTLIYILVSALLTGIVRYPEQNVPSPISHAMLLLGFKTAAGLIGVGAIAGLTTVMLVLFYGVTRIFLALARDGLLPKIFAHTSPSTHTPVRVIFCCGIIMATIAACVTLHDLAELVNIGTLFAFITVCTGVIILRYRFPDVPRPFKTPFMPYIPILGIISCTYLIAHLPWITDLRFIIWMMIGLTIYFTYSRFHSALHPQ